MLREMHARGILNANDSPFHSLPSMRPLLIFGRGRRQRRWRRRTHKRRQLDKYLRRPIARQLMPTTTAPRRPVLLVGAPQRLIARRVRAPGSFARARVKLHVLVVVKAQVFLRRRAHPLAAVTLLGELPLSPSPQEEEEAETDECDEREGAEDGAGDPGFGWGGRWWRAGRGAVRGGYGRGGGRVGGAAGEATAGGGWW